MDRIAGRFLYDFGEEPLCFLRSGGHQRVTQLALLVSREKILLLLQRHNVLRIDQGAAAIEQAVPRSLQNRSVQLMQLVRLIRLRAVGNGQADL
ncbi:hypothetical protein D3C78_1152270 [compost metagenome]